MGQKQNLKLKEKDLEENLKCKILFLHESYVGASSKIKVAIGEEFNNNRINNMKCSINTKNITFKNKIYQLEFWDTSGLEKDRSVNKIFMKESKIIIFVYDITNKRSFEQLDYWLDSAKYQFEKDANVIYGIIGNKKDLKKYQKVTEEEAYKYANSNGIKLKIVSAKENPKEIRNFINELFYDYISKISKKKKKFK